MGVWPYFLAAIFAAFLALEIRAKLTGRPTLSRAIWRLQARFPIYGFVAGVVIGGLAVHFFGLIPACKP